MFALRDNRALITQRFGGRIVKVYPNFRVPESQIQDTQASFSEHPMITHTHLLDLFKGWDKDLMLDGAELALAIASSHELDTAIAEIGERVEGSIGNLEAFIHPDAPCTVLKRLKEVRHIRRLNTALVADGTFVVLLVTVIHANDL